MPAEVRFSGKKNSPCNIRLKNQLAPGTEGGWTTHLDSGDVLSIYDAAERYGQAGTGAVDYR